MFQERRALFDRETVDVDTLLELQRLLLDLEVRLLPLHCQVYLISKVLDSHASLAVLLEVYPRSHDFQVVRLVNPKSHLEAKT